jgi:hypothetical protein
LSFRPSIGARQTNRRLKYPMLMFFSIVLRIPTRRRFFLLLSVASMPTFHNRVQAFSSSTVTFFGRKVLRNFSRLDCMLSSMAKSEDADGVVVSRSFENELWLDLRGTAIFPKQALGFLQQVLFDCEEDIDKENRGKCDQPILNVVSRVLLSEEVFAKVVALPEYSLIDFLYVSQTHDLMEMCRDTEQSVSIGRMLACSPRTTIDPLAALDTYALGGWLMIHSEEDDLRDSTAWIQQQISSLVEFLAGRASSSTASASGLLIPSLNTGFDQTSLNGGVAICCPTKNALVQVDSILAQSRYTSVMTTTTDSVVLLPITSSAEFGQSSSSQAALVLPFDALLWRTAIQMRASEGDELDI